MKLTRKQVLATLKQRGWIINFDRGGRRPVEATSPQGERGLFDPSDLLAELEQNDRKPRSDQ